MKPRSNNKKTKPNTTENKNDKKSPKPNKQQQKDFSFLVIKDEKMQLFGI